MILSDTDILNLLRSGQLEISPLDDIDEQVQPASVDMRISTDFYRFEKDPNIKVRPNGEDPLEVGKNYTSPEGEQIELEPDDFILSSTVEEIRLPDDICGVLFGRSGFGRLGVIPHVGAGFVNPGWHGRLTLELINHGPHTVVLEPGQTRIIQIVFIRTESPSEVPYGERPDAKYQGQKGVSRSRASGTDS